jgi:molybdopterin-binding protein
VKLSARNILPGKVVAIKKGVTTANVKIEIARGAVITSSITMEAARDLKLKVGDRAFAIVKASEVIIGK